jgi:hypothetical protein
MTYRKQLMRFRVFGPGFFQDDITDVGAEAGNSAMM